MLRRSLQLAVENLKLQVSLFPVLQWAKRWPSCIYSWATMIRAPAPIRAKDVTMPSLKEELKSLGFLDAAFDTNRDAGDIKE
jgi:hypothetical protein